MKVIKFFNVQKIAFLSSYTINFLCFQIYDVYKFFLFSNFCVFKKNKKNIVLFFNCDYFLSKRLTFLLKVAFFFFIRFIKFLQIVTCRILILRGKGWGVFLEKPINGFQRLELRLGFSMRVFLYLPVGLKIFFSRAKILIEGLDSHLVNSFANLLNEYKRPNIYTGKGFWKYREKRVLRVGKILGKKGGKKEVKKSSNKEAKKSSKKETKKSSKKDNKKID